MKIEECEGYRSLKKAVDKDDQESNFHDYQGKFKWVIDRCNHYSEKTGLDPAEILCAWEENRNYWYMNYYQEANQPEIKNRKVRIFNTLEDVKVELKGQKFRCPACNGLSNDPYTCDTGTKDKNGKACDWKAYGLLRTLGTGAYVFIKEKALGQEIFMPEKWEIA